MLIKFLYLLKVTSFNSNLLELFYLFLQNLFKGYHIQTNTIYLKKKKKKITLLKSAHVHKKAREQFQLIKFSFLISFCLPQSKAIDFFSTLKLNTPKMIDIRIYFKKNFYLNSKSTKVRK